MSEPTRRFTEEEMAVILRRASALQEARDARSVSLQEIQDIGAQVGIDPALIAHVAQRSSLRGAGKGGQLRLPPTNVYEERRVDAPIAVRDYGQVLDAIRRVARTQGRAQQVFDSLEWRTGSDRDAQWYAVTVTGRPDATYVRVEGEIGVSVALLHIVGIVPTLAIAATSFGMLDPVAAGAVTAVGVAGILAGIRGLWRRMLRKTEARVQALVAEVEKEVRQVSGRETSDTEPSGTGSSSEGRLAPPA